MYRLCLLLIAGILFFPGESQSQVIPRPEHPRPDWERKAWLNLNGEWEFAETDDNARTFTGEAAQFPDKIMVPFARESSLSGLGRLGFVNNVWYRRSFDLPANFNEKRVNINIGASDWRTTVWVNGTRLGTHTGGNTAFGFEITSLLRSKNNIVVIHAFDDTRSGIQAVGKQCQKLNSEGCSYTRTTGIWQTVWLEAVGVSYLKNPKIDTDPSTGRVLVRVEVDGTSQGLSVKARALDNGKVVAEDTVPADWRNNQLLLDLGKNVKKWSVRSPFLYDLELELSAGGRVIDKVRSYFGVRSLQIEGRAVLLNGEPVFQRLVLDQGFYPDGIWTAPSEEALKKDIQLSMDCGFNGARLHQKVFEPRFLYWADRMGYLVWGEFPNWGIDFRKTESHKPFIDEWTEILMRDRNHPAIVGWCPFNETPVSAVPLQETIVRMTRVMDPSRPVLETSGWSHRLRDPEMLDCHDYNQDPASFRARYVVRMGAGEELPDYLAPWLGIGSDLPFFVSEYGGIGWDTSGGWGYGSAPKILEEFYDRFQGLARAQLENPGLFGFCYTQLTDVEQEKNGLYYYDTKRTPKFDCARIKAMLDVPAAYEKNPPLLAPVKNPVFWTSLIGSGRAPEQLRTVWRYTMEPVTAENWMMPGFDDSTWKQSTGEFSNVAQGARQWKTSQIYLRQKFQYDGVSFDKVVLAIRWDEDAVVYLNGKVLKELPRWSDEMQTFDITGNFRQMVRQGQNTIAIICRQKTGGQAIDMSLLLKK